MESTWSRCFLVIPTRGYTWFLFMCIYHGDYLDAHCLEQITRRNEAKLSCVFSKARFSIHLHFYASHT